MTDQAAGLRRRAARLATRAVMVFSASPQSAPRLAEAFHAHGRVVLLIDMQDRQFSASARNLFGWRQQLERGQALTLPMPYGDGWRAPGVRLDEPALAALARRYDLVVVDAAPNARELVLMPDATHLAAIEVQGSVESLHYAYRLVKTLAQRPAVAGVGLFGDAAACARVLAASGNFLAPAFSDTVCSVAAETDAFAALAVRMSAEEGRLTALNNKGENPNHGR